MLSFKKRIRSNSPKITGHNYLDSINLIHKVKKLEEIHSNQALTRNPHWSYIKKTPNFKKELNKMKK
jgi:hypothetical protein